MASAPTATTPSVRVFSCRCLNIRVCEAPTDITYKSFVKLGADADFVPLYVGEHGVEARHPQLTLRDRSRSSPLPDSPNSARYTSLTCLLCQSLVYRVQEIIDHENESKEGPVLPSDNWVEVDVLRSTDGWVEIQKSCPTQEGVALLEKSPRYSHIYSIVLPAAQSPPTSPTPDADDRATRPSPLHQKRYLAELPPLFPPPPFTPKHPVFQHLSSLATEKSEGLRKEAEGYISEVVQAKVKDIQKAEDTLKKDAEHVWKAFLGAINNVKHRQQDHVTSPTQRTEIGVFTPNGAGTPAAASVIRDFVPSKVAQTRRPPTAAPRTSTLSASLATSSFHHPKYSDDTANPSPPKSPGSSASNDAATTNSSITVTSSTFPIRPTADNGQASVLQFRHWANEQEEKNVATSYRYFQNEEEDHKRLADVMERRKQQQQQAQEAQQNQATAGPSTPQANGKAKEQPKISTQAPPAAGTKTPESPSGKGKRKVTFDVDPAAANRHGKADKTTPPTQDDDDMVFDLEEENGERQSKAPILPLNEPSATASRPPRPAAMSPRHRSQSAGLPSSFAGLRPASLPAPSMMRSIAGSAPTGDPSTSPLNSRPSPSQQPQASTHTSPSLPSPYPNGKHHIEPESDASEPEPGSEDDFRTREIQRLVAANTPSHRNAWKRDSDAWKRFLSRPSDDALEEISEDEGGESEAAHLQHQHFVGSLPIAIRPPPRRASTSDYQAKTSLVEEPGVLVPPLPRRRESSTARRKQMYGERDRERGLDPGALDFTGEEDEEESDEDTTRGEDGKSMSRGKQRALKILESASKVPEEGMWRSLANN
ncbi:hypothetical protein BD626DRAFT_107199 [Schizophyllum amplum]|uniref:Uncharacterized protein n=1 Tax=Schizophyllum amplum TaxID=97359 RepID=A0A550CSU6_9AGAR|nr:hypothetical protein BD626DRAFT_107199 [Auriculariopsis ampla]